MSETTPPIENALRALSCFTDKKRSRFTADSFAEHWLQCPPALAQYVRSIAHPTAGHPPQDELTDIQAALKDAVTFLDTNAPENGTFRTRISSLVPKENPWGATSSSQFLTSLHHLANIHLRAARVALVERFCPPQPDEQFADLKSLFTSLDAAWDLGGAPIKGTAAASPTLPDPDKATRLLDRFTLSLPTEGTPGYTLPHHAAARHLLAWLLGHDTSSLDHHGRPVASGATPFVNHITPLLVSSDGEKQKIGSTLRGTVDLATHSAATGFLDPLSVGLMTFDDKLRESLRVASALATNTLNAPGRKVASVAVRIAFAPRQILPFVLHGDSAGGLLVIASLATALGIDIDADATASFTVSPVSDNAAKKLRDRPRELTAADFRIGPVGGLPAKLNRQVEKPLKERGIQRVFLCDGQKSDDGHPWSEWVPPVARETGLSIVPVASADGQAFAAIQGVLEAMTGDARIEAVLDRYCDAKVDEWQACRDDDNDRDALAHYLPPSFSRKLEPGKTLDSSEIEARKREGIEVANPYKPISDPEADEDTRFFELFALGKRLVVTEDAGAGKTIFTRRGVAWCSDEAARERWCPGRALLAFRWERVETNWPTTVDGYFDSLRKAVEPYCRPSSGTAGSEPTPAEVIEYALRHGRVVAFCDALDQVAESGGDTLIALDNFEKLLKNAHPENRLVVTSRAMAYEQHQTTLSSRVWQLCRLDGFSPIHQLRYLADLVERFALITDEHHADWKDWRERSQYPRTEPENPWDNKDNQRLTPDEFAFRLLNSPGLFNGLYDSVRELLAVPAILAFVRRLCDSTESFPRFTNRADLYFQANHDLLNRNLDPKKQDEVKAHKVRQRINELRELLSAIAFQMMLKDQRRYVVQGETAVEKLKESVRTLVTTKGVQDRFDELWDLVESLAGFTSHLVVEQKSRDYFGWKHRGMMEFYCGMFLARNSCDTWPPYDPDEQPIPLAARFADPQWNWAVRFALELLTASDPDARGWPHAPSLERTLHNVFAQQSAHSRPTQLIYLAEWSLRRLPEWSATRDRVLRAYRQQFRNILAGVAAVPGLLVDANGHVNPRADIPSVLGRAKLAAESIWEGDLGVYLEPYAEAGRLPAGETLDSWLAQIKPKVGYEAYALCSNGTSTHSRPEQLSDTQWLTFLMGASPKDKSTDAQLANSTKQPYGGGPWREVKIRAFRIGTCAVTRSQYRLFDAVRENSNRDGDYGKDHRAPDDDCPITDVDWFDSFVYALWLGEGYVLPTEAQWEGAAWGGLGREARPDAVIGVTPYTAKFTSEQVNFNGNTPMKGQPKSGYAERTLPVRWDETRRIMEATSGGWMYLPAAYETNGFLVWQMSGNTYEWCVSVWQNSLDDAVDNGETGPMIYADIGMPCSVRGGSWYYYDLNCRCFHRGRIDADDRDFIVSFRVAKTL